MNNNVSTQCIVTIITLPRESFVSATYLHFALLIVPKLELE